MYELHVPFGVSALLFVFYYLFAILMKKINDDDVMQSG